jgi:deazaflavin-dependent oxidoreductase (nitroreductase family)
MATITGVFTRLHRFVYVHTNGRVGHRLTLVPTLLLRTTGRRSGATRASPLIYARDGRDYVVVGSNWGRDSSPAWLVNLVAAPDVEIQVGRERMPATARVVEAGDADYARLWRLVNANNHGRYDRYQTQTARPIPMVVLSPAGSRDPGH